MFEFIDLYLHDASTFVFSTIAFVVVFGVVFIAYKESKKYT